MSQIPLNHLIDGNITAAITTTYTGIMGDWFIIILLFSVLMVVQFRTQSIEATSITALVLGAVGWGSATVFGGLIGGIVGADNINLLAVYALLMVFGLGMMIWRVFKRE